MKKALITLVALCLVIYAPAQKDHPGGHISHSSKVAESGEDSKGTDKAPDENGEAGVVPGFFAKDMTAPGLSVVVHPDPAAQMMLIDIKGAADQEFRAVLTNGKGDIIATRTISASYEWDLFGQEPGQYQLVILNKKDGSLLARKRFEKN